MRPIGVTLVCIYQVLRALAGMVFGFFILFFVGPANKFAAITSFGNAIERLAGQLGHAVGLVVICFALLHLIATYGLWVMRNWGRLFTILFFAIELALIISRGVGMNRFSLLVGVLNAACIFYLAMPPVRRGFLGSRVAARTAIGKASQPPQS
ncbi:MAG: hypothetical protein ACLQLC_02240 [Candidatus Sulfotelmatobacter sp.]